MSNHCNCCPDCWENPCAGCHYGIGCDNVPCDCDKQESDEEYRRWVREQEALEREEQER